MNFTLEIKKEISSARRNRPTGLAAKSALSAFVRTSGTVGVSEGKPTFFIVSETENVAEFFMELFAETFGAELYISSARRDRMSGRDKLVLLCPDGESARVLRELQILDGNGEIVDWIPDEYWEDEAARTAYIKGAFLGGGSCTLPSGNSKSGYHLEFVFSDRNVAESFCDLLDASSLWAKLTFVAYIKSKEMISDFLALVGADTALKKFVSVLEKREEAGRKNREANFLTGNVDKTVTASAKQVRAIQKLKETGAYEGLEDDLKALADLREKEPTKTLQQLADMLGVSKSCLNHRMRRLTELADQMP